MSRRKLASNSDVDDVSRPEPDPEWSGPARGLERGEDGGPQADRLLDRRGHPCRAPREQLPRGLSSGDQESVTKLGDDVGSIPLHASDMLLTKPQDTGIDGSDRRRRCHAYRQEHLKPFSNAVLDFTAAREKCRG